MSEFYEIGKLVNTHGLRGDVKVIPNTDFIEERFAQKAKVFIKFQNNMIPATVKTVKSVKNFLLVTFSEFDDINQVEQYKGSNLYVSDAQLHDLTENSYYYHEIIGLKVIDEITKQVYGTVSEILAPGANDVWVVDEGNGKSFMLPFIKDVVKRVDLEQQVVEVELMEGLRDED